MNNSDKPADAILERFLLGELPPERMRELQAGMQRNESLKLRIEAMRVSNAEILRAYPASDILAGMRARRRPAPVAFPRPLSRRLPRFRPLAAWGLAGALASVLALVFIKPAPAPLPQLAAAPDTAAGGEVRLKGLEAGLVIFKKTPAGSQLLPPHSLARSGDTLQVFYQCAAPLYGVIVSVDGAGSVTLHLPEAAGPAARLEPGEMRPLPHAYRLDRAPRLERFYLVTAREPFPVEQALGAFKGAPVYAPPDSLPGLPPGFRQFSYTLRKPEGKTRRPARKGLP